jgi:formate-dependent nitrite reductase cytochrome c552 subunit
MNTKILLVSLLWGALVLAGAASAETFKEQCKTCHSDIYSFLSEGKHKMHDCSTCHGKNSAELNAHMSNPKATKPEVKPIKEGPKFCGKCHQKYYEQYRQVNWKSTPKIEKGSPHGRAPPFDLLLYRYGFVFEHAEPRSHVFMLLDHVIVDRGYKGRFRLKDYRYFVPPDGWDGDIRVMITDAGKDYANAPWKGKDDVAGIKPRAFGAGNRVCLNCKTTDYIVGWETISKGGNKTGFAKFVRAGNDVAAEDIAKGVIKHSLNCVHCHDPHFAKMRVVRDALIEAVKQRGPYPYDKAKNEKAKKQYKVVAFPAVKNNYREVIVWDSDAKPKLNWLTCAQCHVDYECNPVTDAKTDKKLKFDDPRTNVFTWRNIEDGYNFYLNELGIYTFRHKISKARLIKIQHPEVEVWWESKHAKAGVTCIDCHMPEQDGIKLHSPISPQDIGVDKTCLKCHTNWDEEQANYVIEAIQEYSKGKMRDAEFHLSRLVETIAFAEKVGVDPVKLEEARELHSQAHMNWEWWTAENSDGFHDPDEAWLTLGKASTLAEKGWTMLDEEIKKKLAEISAKAPDTGAALAQQYEELSRKYQELGSKLSELQSEVAEAKSAAQEAKRLAEEKPAPEAKGVCGPTAIAVLALLPFAAYAAMRRKL